MQDKLEHLLDAFMRSDDPEDTLTAVEEAISNPVMIFDEQNELPGLPPEPDEESLQGPVQDDLIKQLYKADRSTDPPQRSGRASRSRSRSISSISAAPTASGR